MSENFFNPVFFGISFSYFLFLIFPLILFKSPFSMTSLSDPLFKTLLFFNLCGLTDFISSFSSDTPLSFVVGILSWGVIFLLWFVFYLDSLINILFNKTIPPLAAALLSSLEMISLMARTVSLGLRLTANILAGKLLGHMLFNMSTFSNFFPSLFFLHLEVLVAILQAYIFFSLSFLYWKEMMNHCLKPYYFIPHRKMSPISEMLEGF